MFWGDVVLLVESLGMEFLRNWLAEYVYLLISSTILELEKVAYCNFKWEQCKSKLVF